MDEQDDASVPAGDNLPLHAETVRQVPAETARRPPPKIERPLPVKSELTPDNRRRPPREIEARAQSESPDAAIEWAVDALQLDFAKATESRRQSFLLRLFVFVGIPTLLAALYVYVYASPRYVSEVQVVYQSSSPIQTQTPSALTALLGASGGGLDMQRVMSAYIGSDTLLSRVNKQLNLRAHYSNPKIDWLDRLPAKATEEDFLTYFRKRVNVNVMMGGYNIIDVEAFDPQMAATIAQTMGKDIDAMVESLTERERTDEMTFANSELARAQKNLLAAKLKTTEFRNSHREFDPLATATQLETTVVGGLETQLAQYNALLNSRRQILSANSPTIKSLQSQINALEQQIEAERTRLASGPSTAKGSGVPYSDLVAQFTTLTQNEQFAVDAYTAAQQANELARADAQRKQNYVEAFVKANVPQRSTAPDPFTTILGTFVISLLVYAGGSLLISAFRDQAGV